jgi:3',5'-cyclic-AMP phosphodiesterase
VPFTIVQLSDPHIGAPWSEDPGGALRRTVEAVRRVLGGPPDAYVLTGDVSNNGADAEYAEASDLLARAGAPVYALPGNHDDRGGLRRHFGCREIEGGYLCVAADLGPVRLITLDTKRPGSDAGELPHGQREWLEARLGEAADTPTLIAMHHPPLLTGMPGMDPLRLADEDREALAAIVGRHPQVHVIAAGHVHRAIVGPLAGACVIAIPSTDVQLELDFDSPEIAFVHEPPCFAVHVLAGDRLVSHVQPVS